MTPDPFTPGFHLPYHKWMKLSRITSMLIMKYQAILTKNIVRYIWKISAQNSPEDIHAGYLQFIQMNSNPKISSYIVSKFLFFELYVNLVHSQNQLPISIFSSTKENHISYWLGKPTTLEYHVRSPKCVPRTSHQNFD